MIEWLATPPPPNLFPFTAQSAVKVMKKGHSGGAPTYHSVLEIHVDAYEMMDLKGTITRLVWVAYLIPS